MPQTNTKQNNSENSWVISETAVASPWIQPQPHRPAHRSRLHPIPDPAAKHPSIISVVWFFFLMVEHFKNPFRIILWFVCFRDLDSQNLYCFSRQIKEVGRGLFLPNSDEKGTLIKTLPEHFFVMIFPLRLHFPKINSPQSFCPFKTSYVQLCHPWRSPLNVLIWGR